MLTTITMTEIKNPAHVRKNDEKEFKLRLCREVDSGLKQAEVCRKYGVSAKLMSSWYKDFTENGKDAFVGTGHYVRTSRENAKTRQQIAALKAAKEAMKVAVRLSRQRDKLISDIKEMLASVG